jgi:hypothetical protein
MLEEELCEFHIILEQRLVKRSRSAVVMGRRVWAVLNEQAREILVSVRCCLV